MEYDIVRLCDRPELKDELAQWFHGHWGVPLAAYRASMADCLRGARPVPQWYAALEQGRIIGGMGVIENDFHDRKDLAPNVCAVYVEEDRRGHGIAEALLAYVCEDMRQRGIPTLYLITDHTSLYERYGWRFLCMVRSEGEGRPTRMYVHE